MSEEFVPPPQLNLISRTLPHDEEAECAVLASILINPKQCIPLCRKIISNDSFFNPANQEIFSTLITLGDENESVIDVIILANALTKKGTLERVGGRVYLAYLAGFLPSEANAQKYIDIVFQQAILRRLIRFSSSISDRCYENTENVKELIDVIETEVFDLTQSQNKDQLASGMNMLIDPAFRYIIDLASGEKKVQGLSTGYPDLDNLVTGLRADEMIVLAARPSIGKTAFALNIASNIAFSSVNQGCGVGIFSLEMSKEMLAVRLLCGEARVSVGDIRDHALTSNMMTDISEAASRLKQANIFIDDTPAIDILELRSKARKMYLEQGVRCFIIDYLQLLKVDSVNKNASRENEVAKISGAIKALAKELHVPIIVLAQLNRNAEQGEQPKLSHLRESGAIEQDADIVMMLHRDRNYEADPNNEKASLPAELIIAKHRNGPTGIVKLQFFAKYTRFESASRISDEDVPMN